VAIPHLLSNQQTVSTFMLSRVIAVRICKATGAGRGPTAFSVQRTCDPR